MTEETAPGSTARSGEQAGGGEHLGGGDRPSGPHLAGPVQILRRSTTDRKLAGVCGGLGAFTNIDPLIFRVLFAVFSLFGGFGVLLYGVAWLIIPEQGTDRSEIQQLAQGHGISTAAAWALGTTALGFVIFAAIVSDRWNVVVWVVVIGGIAYFIVRSRNPPAGDRVGAWWSDHPPTGAPPDAAPASYAAASADAAAASPPSAPPDTPPPVPPYTPTPSPPPAPRPKRARSITGWVTMSAALLAAGALAALDAADVVAVPTAVILATALVVLGVGLIVATWFGRARGLIGPGFALILALAVVTSLEPTLHGPIGDVALEPASITEIENPYRASAGQITIDLRRLDLHGSAALIEASVGLGEIEVLYPDDILIQADTAVEIGGIDKHRTDRVREVGGHVEIQPRGPSQGTVRLDLQVGVGNITFMERSRVSS